MYWDRGDLRFAVLVPQHFVEAAGVALTIALLEFFYGFLRMSVTFQLIIIVISTDPQKYRPVILPSIVEKFSSRSPLRSSFAPAESPSRVRVVATFPATVPKRMSQHNG